MSALAVAEETDKPLYKTQRRLSPEQVQTILELSKQGHTHVYIAAQIGCTRQAVRHQVEKYSDSRELAIKYLQSKALSSIKLWHKAAQVGADKGRHEGAQSLVEAAIPELRPAQAQSGSSIVIAIGQPGAALGPPDITICDNASTLSPSLSHDLHRLTDGKQ